MSAPWFYFCSNCHWPHAGDACVMAWTGAVVCPNCFRTLTQRSPLPSRTAPALVQRSGGYVNQSYVMSSAGGGVMSSAGGGIMSSAGGGLLSPNGSNFIGLNTGSFRR